MKNTIKIGLIGLMSILPLKAFAEGPLEDTLFYKAQRKGFAIAIDAPLDIPDSGTTYRWLQQAWTYKGDLGNDTLAFFKDGKYIAYAADDSAETSFTVGLMKRNNIYHHKFNRSIPLDSEANIIVRELQNGLPANSVISQTRKQPVALNNRNTITGYFNLRGQKATRKETSNAKLPNGVYVNSGRKLEISK
jgi:hypothetical protein